jgi:hypothetical protein
LWSARAGDRTVVLSLDPGLIGSNQTRVTVRAADGSLVMPSAVALRTVPPAASGIRPSLVRLAQEGDTHAAVLGLGSEGEWALELLLDDERVATFRVTVTGQTGASSEVEP